MSSFAKSVKLFLPKNEIRRFEIVSEKYEDFCTKVNKVFSGEVEGEVVRRFMYLDDEGDWVSMASKEEFGEGLRFHSKGAMKVKVVLDDVKGVLDDVKSDWKPTFGKKYGESFANVVRRCRGGRGRGRGRWRGRGRGGRGRDVSPKTKKVRMERRLERISKNIRKKKQNFQLSKQKHKFQLESMAEKTQVIKERIKHVQQKINEKADGEKKGNLEKKLEKMKAKKDMINDKIAFKKQKFAFMKQKKNFNLDKAKEKKQFVNKKLKNLGTRVVYSNKEMLKNNSDEAEIKRKLGLLHSLGFHQRKMNRSLLEQHNGDITAVIKKLFNDLEETKPETVVY